VSRLARLATLAALFAGAAHAQRLDVDPARSTSYDRPITARVGEVFASELSESDMSPFPGWRAEHFVFTGRAGETVTVQVQSDIPTLVVSLLQDRKRELVRGPAGDAPLRVVLPRDGAYFVVVGANGPLRNGKYQLSFGSSDPAAVPAHAVLAPAPAAQRVDITAQPNNFVRPYPVHAGQLIASELTASDLASGVDRSAEYMVFTGRAGQVVTAQVRSDIPSLQVHIRSWRSRTGKALVEGPARGAPVRLDLPKDDEYVIVVHSQGPQRFGKYLLSIGDGVTTPPFDPPAPMLVAEAAPAPKPAPKPADPPTALPPLPVMPGVTNVRVGETLARPAGKAGTGVEVFAFIGESGSILQASAAGAGRYGLTLHTPEGAEMLTATGQGAARVEAVLPKDGVYLMAVASEDAAKPYKLTLGSESPDAFLWAFRHLAGYEALGANGATAYWTCWVVPGSVLQYHLPNGSTQRLTVNRGGAGRWDLLPNGGYNFTTSIEGSTFVRTSEGGKVQAWSLDGPNQPHGAYRGYLCR
jgi:hypothetical protein